MRNYNEVDPEQYDTRHERKPSERYDHDHWRPLIESAISRYCENKLVLDLGCGTGAYTKSIAQHANLALGLDISKRMLTYAKETKYGSFSLALADVHHIPLKAKSIDAVVSIGLFECVERVTALEEINRVLKPQGICIIGCANKYSAWGMVLKIACKVFGREWAWKEPSYREMLMLLKQKGFEVMEFKMDDGLIWLPDFLDRLVGRRIYLSIEKLFRIVGKNPFSSGLLFVGRKARSR